MNTISGLDGGLEGASERGSKERVKKMGVITRSRESLRNPQGQDRIPGKSRSKKGSAPREERRSAAVVRCPGWRGEQKALTKAAGGQKDTDTQTDGHRHTHTDTHHIKYVFFILYTSYIK